MSQDGNHHGRRTGRGAVYSPANRFEAVRVEYEPDDGVTLDPAKPQPVNTESSKVATELLPDASRSIIVQNDSPDIPFRYSVNPYRGCEHGCSYCYARPGHEFLGMNSGLDFETKIVVKYDAPRLLRDALCRPKWQGEILAMSGVTDCYQPVERELRITRGCLEVLREAQQAVGLITKNSLIVRDLDLLQPMAERGLIHVNISLTTLDQELSRRMEPRTATPEARLNTIRALAAVGVPVRVMIAPLIPGLTDRELPQILATARDAGAQAAGWQLLRLPLSVAPIFRTWLEEHRPESAGRILGLLREMHRGQLNETEFDKRMRGTGAYADSLQATFQLFAKKYELDRPLPPLDTTRFRPPRESTGQQWLFRES